MSLCSFQTNDYWCEINCRNIIIISSNFFQTKLFSDNRKLNNKFSLLISMLITVIILIRIYNKKLLTLNVYILCNIQTMHCSRSFQANINKN
jgi:hypothetical protein